MFEKRFFAGSQPDIIFPRPSAYLEVGFGISLSYAFIPTKCDSYLSPASIMVDRFKQYVGYHIIDERKRIMCKFIVDRKEVVRIKVCGIDHPSFFLGRQSAPIGVQ